MEKQKLININAILFIGILVVKLFKFYDVGDHFLVMLFTSVHDYSYYILFLTFTLIVSIYNKMNVLDVLTQTLRTAFAMFFGKERLNLMQIGMTFLWLIVASLIVVIIINIFPEVLHLSKELVHRLYKTDYAKHRDLIAYTFATTVIFIFIGGKLIFDYLIWGNIKTGSPLKIFKMQTTSQRVTIIFLFLVFNAVVEIFNAYCFSLNKLATNVNNGKLADSNGQLKLASMENPQTNAMKAQIESKEQNKKTLLALILQKTEAKKPLQAQFAWGTKSSKEYAKRELEALQKEIETSKATVNQLDTDINKLHNKLNKEFESVKLENLEIKNEYKKEKEFWSFVGYSQGVSLGVIVFILLTCLHILEGSKIQYNFNVKNVESVKIGAEKVALNEKSGLNLPKIGLPSLNLNFKNPLIRKEPDRVEPKPQEQPKEPKQEAKIEVDNEFEARAKVVSKFENHNLGFIVPDLIDFYLGKDGKGQTLYDFIREICKREHMGLGEAIIEKVRNFFNNTLKKALQENGLQAKYRS